MDPDFRGDGNKKGKNKKKHKYSAKQRQEGNGDAPVAGPSSQGSDIQFAKSPSFDDYKKRTKFISPKAKGEQKEFEGQPVSHLAPEKSARGQRLPEDQSVSQLAPERTVWSQSKPQDRPFSQPHPETSAWGQSKSQDRPVSQQYPETSPWGQKKFQDQYASQQSFERSAWSQRPPQVLPGLQQAAKKPARKEQGFPDQSPSQEGFGRSAWSQKPSWVRPVSQQTSERSPWGHESEDPNKTKQNPQIQELQPVSKDIDKISQGFTELKPGSTESFASLTFAPRRFANKRSGTPIVVSTNFFRLNIKNPNLIVYDYDVKMDPDKPKHLIREVWNKFAAREFPNKFAAFSGKNAYSNGPLMKENSRSGSIIVHNKETNRDKEFQIVVTEVRRVNLKCFNDFRRNMGRNLKILPESETMILDLIIRNWACDNYIRSGRSFFLPSSKTSQEELLSNKLILRDGYYQAVFLGYDLFLNFDLSHKAFYRPLQVLELFKCFRTDRNFGYEEMNAFIKGMKVKYKLPNAPLGTVYSVNGLVKDADTQTFKKDDGTEMTVSQYLQKEKSIRLRYPDLPLLWVGSRQRSIFIPMEFCEILPDQVYKGPVEPQETRVMVEKASKRDPRNRKLQLQKLFREININKHKLMSEFGLEISPEMEKVEGRVLDPPKLMTSQLIKVREGEWNINEFFKPKELKNWCILKMDRRMPRNNIISLQNLIKNKARNYNMRVEDPARDVIDLDPNNVREMEKVFSELGNMDLVIVVLPDMKGVYSKVKTICETRAKVLTQCVKSRTISNPKLSSSTIGNILLKVNAKLGGINHTLDETSFPECLKGKVMIVGADVTHPSPGMKIPSVAAVAVSCDEAAFKYSTTTRVQPKGELILDLEEIITKHLLEFYKLRKCYPEKIIFFRDGVSEGELSKVLHAELGAVKRACQKYCKPKITLLVVQKRHHTRFYPESPRDERKNNNVPVGTCIDTKIIHPRDMDFYLVSHASRLGTVRPTRYRLLHDDNNYTDDELEKLAFYLCHMFSRCNRSVSYPSPTYNAHLAAFRVRAYLEEYRGVSDIADIQKHIKDNISHKAPMFFV